MTRNRVLGLVALLALAAAVFAAATPASRSDDDHDGKRIAIRDDCDRRDPGWAAVGGCTKRGDVSLAEFAGENDSPLASSVVGHQAWRNDPPYLEIKEGSKIRVKNEGGRVHTFTEVAAFGGGIAPNPALNEGLVTLTGMPWIGGDRPRRTGNRQRARRRQPSVPLLLPPVDARARQGEGRPLIRLRDALGRRKGAASAAPDFRCPRRARPGAG